MIIELNQYKNKDLDPKYLRIIKRINCQFMQYSEQDRELLKITNKIVRDKRISIENLLKKYG